MFWRKQYQIDMFRLPRHIAVIMDGNGRWARRRGLPRTAGHSAGADVLKTIVKECNRIGISYITVYAFSTENWKRPKEEVDYLMGLLLDYLRNAEKNLAGENVVIRVLGARDGLSQEIQEQIIKTENFTKDNTGIVMNIALNYGGREEITNAVKNLINDVKTGKLESADVNEEAICSRLYTENIPDPDLIIRTSGEQRLSNFLLWQCAYSEFWFTNKNWPSFRIQDLKKAIYDYQKRTRRFGGV
jgi:undecaprenyl diphosphate synthase